jgi:O-methyltransferase
MTYRRCKLLSATSHEIYMSVFTSLKSLCPPAIRAGVKRAALRHFPFRYSEDGLHTFHNCDFLTSPRFVGAYKAGEETGSWHGAQLRWRVHVILWVASHASQLAGDFVECGVNRGGYARAIIEYLGSENFPRTFYLFDTFRGFSDALLSEREKSTVAKWYYYPDCLADVRRTFAPFPFVKIIPGVVPQTLDQMPPTQVSFLSIDMNCSAPEIAAAEHFWPFLAPGAVMVLDDYGFEGHCEQKAAFDRFAEAKTVPILSLPTGQALIFKPS